MIKAARRQVQRRKVVRLRDAWRRCIRRRQPNSAFTVKTPLYFGRTHPRDCVRTATPHSTITDVGAGVLLRSCGALPGFHFEWTCSYIPRSDLLRKVLTLDLSQTLGTGTCTNRRRLKNGSFTNLSRENFGDCSALALLRRRRQFMMVASAPLHYTYDVKKFGLPMFCFPSLRCPPCICERCP